MTRITESNAPPSAATPKPPGFDAALDALRQLDAQLALDCNKHDRVITLITACLVAGIASPGMIVANLVKLGFNRGHIWRLMKDGTGLNPARHRWWCDADGNLRLHGENLAAA